MFGKRGGQSGGGFGKPLAMPPEVAPQPAAAAPAPAPMEAPVAPPVAQEAVAPAPAPAAEPAHGAQLPEVVKQKKIKTVAAPFEDEAPEVSPNEIRIKSEGTFDLFKPRCHD